MFRGEMLDRSAKLSGLKNPSPVSRVESAAYRALGLSNPNTTVFLGKGGFAVPAEYFDFNPVVVDYAMAIEDDRRDGQEQARRFWDRMCIYAGNHSSELQKFADLLFPFPALMLSVSEDQIKHTAAYLGVEEKVLIEALDSVPYWKASEMLEFRSANDPEHDIVSWICRDHGFPFELAIQHHYLHEAHHSAIDAFSSSHGWNPSNFLTEGFCEFASASLEVHKVHCEELMREFGDVQQLSWQNIRQKIFDGTKIMRFSDYTLGWAIVHFLALIFAENKDPEYGAMRLLFELHNHSINGNLLATFDAIFNNSNIRNQFDSLIKLKVSLLNQL